MRFFALLAIALLRNSTDQVLWINRSHRKDFEHIFEWIGWKVAKLSIDKSSCEIGTWSVRAFRCQKYYAMSTSNVLKNFLYFQQTFWKQPSNRTRSGRPWLKTVKTRSGMDICISVQSRLFNICSMDFLAPVSMDYSWTNTFSALIFNLSIGPWGGMHVDVHKNFDCSQQDNQNKQ